LKKLLLLFAAIIFVFAVGCESAGNTDQELANKALIEEIEEMQKEIDRLKFDLKRLEHLQRSAPQYQQPTQAVCYDCKGFGQVVCNRCKGTGHGISVCGWCNGSGISSGGSLACSICNGSGFRVCYWCWGSGKTTCPSCGGSGLR